MKKWLMILATIFFLQINVASAMEYKVIEIMDSGKKNIESAINQYAKQGWMIDQLFYRQKHAIIVIIFKK